MTLIRGEKKTHASNHSVEPELEGVRVCICGYIRAFPTATRLRHVPTFHKLARPNTLDADLKTSKSNIPNCGKLPKKYYNVVVAATTAVGDCGFLLQRLQARVINTTIS